MMTVKIARNCDPFKKYWWVLLLGFGAVGGWICLPLMDTSVGSGSVSGEAGLRSADQSLDSIHNPSGAPGGAVNLLMEGSGRYKKKDGPIMSSLYQPPEEPVDKTAAAAAPSGTLADALKDISKKTSASASADASGWGGQKAQKGFVAPKINLGAMSGLGGGSGSGATASAGGGAASATSGFGSQKANTGVSFTKGLRDTESERDPVAKGKTLGALQGAQSVSVAAAGQHSYDAAGAMGGRSFDGNAGGGAIGGGGAAAIGGGGAYGQLDGAPINLKANDPTLNQAKFEAPPALPKEAEVDKNEEMRQMIMKMVMMAVVGGLMGGITGPMM